jgi:hypothetical protein
MRRIALALVVALGASLTVTNAVAKGLPTRVVIDGPTAHVVLHEDNSGSFVLMKSSGFFLQVSCTKCQRLQQEPPGGTLGPAYRVTYTTAFHHQRISQVVYPFATPSPVSYMPPGQPFLFGMETTGGWVINDDGSLLRKMLRLGIPAPVEPTASSPQIPNDPPTLPLIGVVIAATLLAALTWLRRRHHVASAGHAVSG